MKSSSSAARWLLLALTLANGVNFTVVKTLLPRYTDAEGLMAVRVLSAAVLFIAGAVILSFKNWKIELKDLPVVALCAFFGVFGNQYFFLKGLAVVPPINASLMILLSPMAVLGLSVFMGRERLTILKTVGMALGCTGAFLLISMSTGVAGGGVWWGYVLIIINSLCWAVYVIMVVPLVKKYPADVLLAYLFIIGSLFHLSTLLFTGHGVRLTDVDTLGWACLAFSVIFATLFSYSINTWSLKHLKPGVASSFIYLQPVTAMAFAVMIGTDSLTLIGSGCAVLIFTGVWLVNRTGKGTGNDAIPESDVA